MQIAPGRAFQEEGQVKGSGGEKGSVHWRKRKNAGEAGAQ